MKAMPWQISDEPFHRERHRVGLANERTPSDTESTRVAATAIRNKDNQDRIRRGERDPGLEDVAKYRHVFEGMVGENDVEFPGTVFRQAILNVETERHSPEFRAPPVYLVTGSPPAGGFVLLSGIAP